LVRLGLVVSIVHWSIKNPHEPIDQICDSRSRELVADSHKLVENLIENLVFDQVLGWIEQRTAGLTAETTESAVATDEVDDDTRSVMRYQQSVTE